MLILEIFGQLFQLVRDLLWPFKIVAAPNRAVRYTFGTPGVTWRIWWGIKEPVLNPDWYFVVPWVQEIRESNCAEDTIDIANLPITSRDGIQATVSYNIRLVVNDPLKFQLRLRQDINPKQTESMPSAIHAECSSAVAYMMRKRSWDRIYKSQGAIERRIKESLTKTLSDWGITVVSGGITVCSQAVPIALISVD